VKNFFHKRNYKRHSPLFVVKMWFLIYKQLYFCQFFPRELVLLYHFLISPKIPAMVANTDIGPTYIFLVSIIIRSMTYFGHLFHNLYFTRYSAKISAPDWIISIFLKSFDLIIIQFSCIYWSVV